MILDFLTMIFIGWTIFQYFRAEKIMKIKQKWFLNKDVRFVKHTYSDMLRPRPKNWYGFKYPMENHYS